VKSWLLERFKYHAIAHEIESSVTLKTKDSWLWTALWIFLVVVTLGFYAIKVSREKFLKEVATTVGPIQGYPREFPALSKRLLVHESRHTYQCVVSSWFVPIVGWIPYRKLKSFVGLIPMLFTYGVLPFPIFLCYGRYRLELDADIASWKWALRNGYCEEKIRDHAKKRIETVSGGLYFYPWPKFLVRRGYVKYSERVIKEV
jgi:hypothetical protein